MDFIFKPIDERLNTAIGKGIINQDNSINAEFLQEYFLHRAVHYKVYNQSTGEYIGLYMCIDTQPKNAKFTLIENNKKYKEFYNDLCIEMNNFIKATEKKVSIDIDINDFNNLKNNKYSLCFAKKVGDEDYNVVWNAETCFLQKGSFSWTPQYQIFATNTFKESVKVTTQTDIITIGLGEQTTMSENGVLSSASTGTDKNSIAFINDYGSIHPAINQICTSVTGEMISTPIYVAKNAVVKGKTLLKPVEKVLIWFEQNIETSTMFTTSRSRSIELDLTASSTISIKYSQEEWKII